MRLQLFKAATMAFENPEGAPTEAFEAALSEVSAHWAALKFLFDVTGRKVSFVRLRERRTSSHHKNTQTPSLLKQAQRQ